MKNSNLLNRLLSYSHEKQSPQRFVRYAAMLIMLLTLGVGQMWGTDLYVMNYDGNWSGTDANKMTGTSSPWVHYGYWNSTKEFKIATSDWSTVNKGSASPTIGGSAVKMTGSDNMSFPTPATQGGMYKITVTQSGSDYYIKIDAVATEQTTWRQISAPKIYWDNTTANYTNVTMINGRYTNYGGDGKGTLASSLTHITNTNLWYNVSMSNGTGDGSQFTSTLFVDANWDSWESGNVPTERALYATSNTAVNTAALNSNTYLFSGANGNRGATLSRSQLSSGYSELNKTQTVEVYVKAAGGSYTKKTSSWPGTLTPDRYYLSDATTATHVNNTALTASSSVTVSAVLTSAFSLSESSTATGYNFDGWGTSSSSTPAGKSSPYSISAITGANTICAFFSEKTYTVTVNNDGHGTTSPSGAQSNKGQITGVAISATPNDGYEFVNWTIESGTGSFEDATDESTTFYPTSAATIQANFRSTVTNSLTVAAGTHVTTVTGSTDPVTLGSKYAISATAFETGYEFYNWTADPAANGTFDNESNASTNVTVKNGSVTVTANAREIMRSITISGGHVYGGVATSTTAGVATSAKITANAPAAGKKFTGWSLEAGVSLKAGSALTDQTIEIYSTADATVTATYADRAQVKMYFAKPTTLSWGTLYAYAWQNSNTSNNNKAYPGVEISTTETINNVVYYVYQYYTEGDGIGGAATGKSTWDRVIFGCNADDKKTGDLTISNGHYYFKSSTGTGKAAAITSAWCIKGSWNGYSEDADQITHSSATAGSKSITLTTGGKTFKIYNIVNETWWRFAGNVTASKSATAMNNADGNMTLTPTIAGSYTFALGSLDGTPTLAITYPTSYQLTYAIGTVKGNEDETSITSSPSTASGSYVPSGNTVTLTAPDEKEGKYEWEGWYINAAGTGAQQCATKEYEVTMDGTKTLYACYTEIKHDVMVEAGENGSVSTTSVNAGVATKSATITATPALGYYFSGWTIPDGVTIATGSGTNVITINATADEKTITANFTELDKIYFRNLSTMEGGAWANVYVYFGVTWNDGKGVQTLSTYANMTQIGTSDIYWAYVPRSFTTSAGTAVAFSNTDMHTWDDFYGNKGAYRTDYNKALNMFVPYHKSSGTTNTTVYYSDGYWKNYPVKAATGAGYYLQTTRGTDLAEFTGQADNLDIIECTVRVDQHDQDKTFHIVSAGGKYFEPYNYSTSKYPKITSTASTMTMKGDDSDGLTVTLTSEGNYRFIIDQSSDVMELTVVYPVGVGDYRIKHSYSDSGTKYAYSDIIKSSDSHPTVSMFYNPSSATMVLQKCTLVNASGPEWNEGTAIDRDKLNKGAGVYQFDLTISGEAGTIDDGAGLYDGPFYIKTDCASGGWANFTANIMDKNTANPTAFDYYFMKWIDLDTENSETKNIKCVIANQYNNAISDTLKSDGIATMVYGEPVLDNDGSVRFSYNSKTNTLKRAYLTGASSLTLETYASGFIYNEGGETDQYGRHPGFVDDVVWTYELTVDAKLGAKAGLRAVWVNKAGTSKEQTLIENDNPIISGTGSGKYKMRLVFDFKTNALISSWTPSGEITDKLKDVDVMLVREGQAASDVITFGDGGSLEPRKLVGSLKFKKTTYFGNVASWNSTTRPLLTFFVSFPFDVKVSDVFGLNSAYGDAYVIRKYDGAERASKGFFRGDGTTSFWKDLTTKDTMNAYEGYIVVLDNDYFNSDAYSLWGGKSELYLYFPSSKGGIISEGSKTIPVPEHECRIDRTFDNGSKILNHMNTDSHWNLIGVPVFTTYDDDNSPAEGTPGAIFADIEGEADAFNYFYEWNSTGNDFAISSAKDYEFKAMHGYMVQYHGDVTFIGSVFTPASVAARRTVEKKNYDIELQVLNNEAEMLNRTYVALRDGASSEFVLNEDVYLSPNNRDAEIYTFAGEYDVAANRLPVENQLVQMGLNVHKAGNYTISMPSTFSGTATLVDTYTNTRTNLAIDEYEVNLPQGTCEDRFLLELNIHKVPTAIDGVDGGSLKDGNAHKFIMNDRMYILKNGVIYDACGNRVQ